MLISKQISYQMEKCFMRSHINVAKQYLALNLSADVLIVGSGAACYLGCDSFLSQVIGWGFDDIDHVSKQLFSIQEFYLKNDFNEINIELSPLCGSHVGHLLSSEGYDIAEFSNISFLLLDEYVREKKQIAHDVVKTNQGNLSEWSEKIAIGFGCPAAAQQFKIYAQSENVTSFHVSIHGEMAAGGIVAIHDEFCDLGVTSTIPEYRGSGLQKALLDARLHYAKQCGVKVALVTTEPGSVSDLNIQKMGFKCAYTRIKFRKKISI